MFLREQVQVPAPVAVVRELIAQRAHDDGLLSAARHAVDGVGTGVRRPLVQDGPSVRLQSRSFSQSERTVVALRVFTGDDSEENQPSWDVNLEIEPSGAEDTLLTLAGVIRLVPGPAVELVEAGQPSRDLRTVGQRFLTEVAALVSAAGSGARTDKEGQEWSRGREADETWSDGQASL